MSIYVHYGHTDCVWNPKVIVMHTSSDPSIQHMIDMEVRE